MPYATLQNLAPELIESAIAFPIASNPQPQKLIVGGKLHCRKSRVQFNETVGYDHEGKPIVRWYGMPCGSYNCEPCAERKRAAVIRAANDGYIRHWGSLPAMMVTLTYHCKSRKQTWGQFLGSRNFHPETYRRRWWSSEQWRKRLAKDWNILRRRIERRYSIVVSTFKTVQDTEQGWPHIHFVMPELINRREFLGWLRTEWSGEVPGTDGPVQTPIAPGTTYFHGALIREDKWDAHRAIHYASRYITRNCSIHVGRRYAFSGKWEKPIYGDHRKFERGYNVWKHRRAYGRWYKRVYDLYGKTAKGHRRKYTPAKTSEWGQVKEADYRTPIEVTIDRSEQPMVSKRAPWSTLRQWSDGTTERTWE